MRARTPIVLLAVATAAAVVAARGALPTESRVTDRPIRQVENGFAGSDTCRACHPSQYASWHASYHRTMTQVASPSTARPDFDNQTVTAVQGRPMQLRTQDDRLFATFDDPDAGVVDGVRPRIERAVTLITGSHNQQVFWYATGHDRVLGQLPAAYLVAEQRWIPRRMAVLHPPGQGPLSETGHWNSTCLVCHATHAKPQFDTPFGSRPIDQQSVQTTAVEFGIACESCHGPSAAHVRANRNPLRRYGLHLTGRTDSTVVQPTRLDPRRGSQVCGQCHSVWEFYDGSGERRANSEGLPFRPGDDLGATRFLAQPTRNLDSPTMQALLADDSRFIRDAFWDDGTVRVSGREYNGLLESPCYTRATTPERTLSCFSCHTLHKEPADTRTLTAWADDQLSTRAASGDTSASEGNEACLQCHEPLRASVTSHTHHAEGSSGSRCFNCHMPYTTYGLLKTIRSHTVSSPSVRESVEARRPNACNLCHLDRTLGWTATALSRWYGTSSPLLGRDEQSVAASLLWLLKGDAGQRAIVAQAMAWRPAQAASGTGWMAPHLARLLDDPYDAVRLGAARSLGALPGFDQFAVDVAAPPAARRQAQLQVMTLWNRTRARTGAVPELLQTDTGDVDVPRVLAVVQQRDNRPMLLRE